VRYNSAPAGLGDKNSGSTWAKVLTTSENKQLREIYLTSNVMLVALKKMTDIINMNIRSFAIS
jgi:hypothetical protein